MYTYLAIIAPIIITAQTPPAGRCPGLYEGTPITQNDPNLPSPLEYFAAVEILEFETNNGNGVYSIIDDLRTLMRNSQTCWPADQFNNVASYGPMFIRLAWHCSGTFRATDGIGGCTGGRQRYGPEASWDDNTNLDKARALLAPIKEKWGNQLSWGDLFILAGTAAIIDMNGPVSEICVGRVDSPDGTMSYNLGPTPEQNACCPCPDQGDCPVPLGADTVGLIYVNPEGFKGEPDPSRSAQQIRDVFGRMNIYDRETVALIGGGHAFGKCHGACPLGPGDPPQLNPTNPWSGRCGTGKGADTFTSGFEGAWTNTPLSWDNQFFVLLSNQGSDYEVEIGPGGKHQWQNPTNSQLMMLTSDLALIADEQYKQIVDEFATDIGALNESFSNAWAKLTTNGGLWTASTFCIDWNSKNAKAHHRKDLKIVNATSKFIHV